jgi:hypothetical protein
MTGWLYRAGENALKHDSTDLQFWLSEVQEQADLQSRGLEVVQALSQMNVV